MQSAGHRAHDLVWYAGYGSNLCAERFRCYIAGGIPPGLTRRCRGARDTTHPRADRPFDIPHRLYFAGYAEGWDGAPCFVDTAESPGPLTHARAYLITWGQFEDVVAQENGRRTRQLDIDPGDLTAGCSVRVGPGRYENVLCVGGLDEIPVVTITAPGTMTEAKLGAPSSTYLEVMIAGLRESHALRDDEIAAYLGAAPGCSEELATPLLALRAESEG